MASSPPPSPWDPSGPTAPGPQPGGWGGGPPSAATPAPGQPAPWGLRLAAAGLDLVLITTPVGVVLLIAAVLSLFGGGFAIDPAAGGLDQESSLRFTAIQLAAYPVSLLVFAVYAAWSYARGDGRTPGKRIVGLRTVRADGRPTTAGFGLLREVLLKVVLFGLVGLLLCGVPLVLNALWPLWDDRDEALHDKLARTRVVRA